MKIAIIENNFVSLLNFVYDYYYKYDKKLKRVKLNENLNFIDEYIKIGEDKNKAIKVRQGIIKKIGKANYYNVVESFLSCNEEKCQIIFEYILLIFKYENKIYNMFDNDIVIKFNYMLKKVKHEAHRMTGFIRFKLMQNGIYYSFFSGDNDILELIINHFEKRFNDQQFILHDIKRNKLCYYDGEKSIIIPTPNKVEVILHEDELKFDKLWQEYFKNVNIKERKNEKQQQNYLPKKYRWFMNEF